MTAEIVSTEIKHRGWSTFLLATIRLPDGNTITRAIEHHGNAVCVLPYDPVRRTAILVQQLRAPALYAAATEQCAWADGLGFETVYLAEHHGADDEHTAIDQAHANLHALGQDVQLPLAPVQHVLGFRKTRQLVENSRRTGGGREA